MLATTLWRHVHYRTFKQLEQSLLYAFAADVASDAGVVLLAGYLVYLVDKDDASFRGRDVVVGHLQQSRQDALYVFAHIAGLGEDGGIHDGEGYVEELGDGACQQGLACARSADHDDVALLYLHFVVTMLCQTLVVVIDCNRQVALCTVLTDDVLVEECLDVARLRDVGHVDVCSVALLQAYLAAQAFAHDMLCLTDTLVADEAVQARQHQCHFVFTASAEGAAVLMLSCHPCFLIFSPSFLSSRGLSCHTPELPAPSSSSRGRCLPIPCRSRYASVRQ